MDVETVVVTSVDELGVGLGIALLSFILSCILPGRYQWKKLTENDKLKVIVIVSILVGNFDYVFDVIVAIQWIKNGDVWWAIMIICTIFLSGVVSWYYRVCHPDKGKLWGKNPFEPSVKDWVLLPIFMFGFGSIYDAINMVCSGYEEGLTYEFQTTRLMEIMIESLPSGALQIYILVLTSNWKNWVETVSIIASLGSVMWGLMTSSSRGIYSSGISLIETPKWNLVSFCFFDFLSNTLSLSLFISVKSIRSFSKLLYFPTILLFNIIMRFYEMREFLENGIVDAMVWIFLQTVSNCKMIISPAYFSPWDKNPFYKNIMLLRFMLNLSFFLIAATIDMFDEYNTFSHYLILYVGIFIMANAFILFRLLCKTRPIRKKKNSIRSKEKETLTTI